MTRCRARADAHGGDHARARAKLLPRPCSAKRHVRSRVARRARPRGIGMMINGNWDWDQRSGSSSRSSPSPRRSSTGTASDPHRMASGSSREIAGARRSRGQDADPPHLHRDPASSLVILVARSSFAMTVKPTIERRLGRSPSPRSAVLIALTVIFLVPAPLGRPSSSRSRRRGLVGFELDEERPGDAVALRDVHSLDGRVVRRRERRLHLHRLEHEQRLPRFDMVARCRRCTWITVPGIGAVIAAARRLPARARVRRCRRRAAAARRRREVQPPAAAPGGVGQPQRRLGERRVLGQERGRRLACPDDGVRDEPAQERQVRRDATDLGLGEARRASRASASTRVGPCAISFAIIGSYPVPISSPSSTPASTRIPVGRRSRSSCPGLREEACADPRRRAAPRPRGPVTDCYLGRARSPSAIRIWSADQVDGR